jgi:zinc and cadmium transporter
MNCVGQCAKVHIFVETHQDIFLYSFLIVMGALGGAFVPIWVEKQKRLLGLLAFAAGVMLGAAFFHMLPEAIHQGGYTAFVVVPLGFVSFFLLERYLLVHACEEPPDCPEHSHGNTLGLTALIGLSIHTLLDGVALGSATVEGIGLLAFIAILAHKIPSSLSLAAILKSEGHSTSGILGRTAIFGLMVPAGAGLYLLVKSWVTVEAFSSYALAFSAGTFLYISVSDLLPHVNRHGPKGRLGNILGMVLGLLLMFSLTFLTGHQHGR